LVGFALFIFMIYVIEINCLRVVFMARYLNIEDISFYNLSVYHYNLHDRQKYIITGYHKGFYYLRTQMALERYPFRQTRTEGQTYALKTMRREA
jgi:hypothetical protein